MDEELCSHIAHRADDLERLGPGACSRALCPRRIGGDVRFKEESRRAMGGSFDDLDAGHSLWFRTMCGKPGFTVVGGADSGVCYRRYNAVVFAVANASGAAPD